MKWNLDKKWEWKPFKAGKAFELRKVNYLEEEEMKSIRYVYANLRELFAKEIAVTVEAHLLPDPRLSEEALDDFLKFWGHDEHFSKVIKNNIQYFASILPKFDKNQIQILKNARNFFSDKRKMEKVRKNIEGAESSKDLFKNGTEEAALHREFLRHLTNIDEMILFKVTKEEHSDTK